MNSLWQCQAVLWKFLIQPHFLAVILMKFVLPWFKNPCCFWLASHRFEFSHEGRVGLIRGVGRFGRDFTKFRCGLWCRRLSTYNIITASFLSNLQFHWESGINIKLWLWNSSNPIIKMSLCSNRIENVPKEICLLDWRSMWWQGKSLARVPISSCSYLNWATHLRDSLLSKSLHARFCIAMKKLS